MERKIAQMNCRIVIQKNKEVVDQYGNHINGWTDFFSCFAYAGTYQYDRESEGVVTEQEQTVSFEVRWCTELKDLDSTHYRVLFQEQVYDIDSVDFMNYQHGTIRIRTRKERA